VMQPELQSTLPTEPYQAISRPCPLFISCAVRRDQSGEPNPATLAGNVAHPDQGLRS